MTGFTPVDLMPTNGIWTRPSRDQHCPANYSNGVVDMADFAKVNEVYGQHIGGSRPARSTVAVAGLPRGVRVEIECVAKLG